MDFRNPSQGPPLARPGGPAASAPNPPGFLANLWCWAWLISLSIAALGLSPWWLLFGRLKGWSRARSAREGIWIYGRLYLKLIRPFIRVEIDNPDLAAAKSPLIITANHQSWLDIYLLGAQNARDICMLVRAWPFKKLFFFGPLMRLASYIETEGVTAEEILDRCRKELERGAVILCFPEGTRSRDGSLSRFRSGAFKLAVELGVPVLPLIIHNSGRVMPKGSFRFRPGTIKMELGPEVTADRFQEATIAHGALRRFVRRIFLARLG